MTAQQMIDHCSKLDPSEELIVLDQDLPPDQESRSIQYMDGNILMLEEK